MPKGKDLSSYGIAIDKAQTLEEARSIFIDMVNNFGFKDKQKLYIDQAQQFRGTKQRFTVWAWNVILSGEGHKVIK